MAQAYQLSMQHNNYIIPTEPFYCYTMHIIVRPCVIGAIILWQYRRLRIEFVHTLIKRSYKATPSKAINFLSHHPPAPLWWGRSFLQKTLLSWAIQEYFALKIATVFMTTLRIYVCPVPFIDIVSPGFESSSSSDMDLFLLSGLLPVNRFFTRRAKSVELEPPLPVVPDSLWAWEGSMTYSQWFIAGGNASVSSNQAKWEKCR